jgi:hypothetical protein
MSMNFSVKKNAEVGDRGIGKDAEKEVLPTDFLIM